jgi:hypothetical protein
LYTSLILFFSIYYYMWLFASSAYRFPSATTDAAKRKYSEKRFEFHVLNGSDSYCSIRLSTAGPGNATVQYI